MGFPLTKAEHSLVPSSLFSSPVSLHSVKYTTVECMNIHYGYMLFHALYLPPTTHDLSSSRALF